MERVRMGRSVGEVVSTDYPEEVGREQEGGQLRRISREIFLLICP